MDSVRQKCQNFQIEIRKQQRVQIFKNKRRLMLQLLEEQQSNQHLIKQNIQRQQIQKQRQNIKSYINEREKQLQQALEQYDMNKTITTIQAICKLFSIYKKQQNYSFVVQLVGLSSIPQKCLILYSIAMDLKMEDIILHKIDKSLIVIITYLISTQYMPEERIIQMKLIEVIKEMLSLNMLESNHISNICFICANCTVNSPKIAQLLFENKIVHTIINIFCEAAPQVTHISVRHFLFLNKMYLQECLGNRDILSLFLKKKDFQYIYFLATEVFQHFVYESFQNDLRKKDIIGDAISLIRIILENGWLIASKLEVDSKFSLMIQVIKTKGCWFELTRQILLILDSVIYSDPTDEYTKKFVKQQYLLYHIWRHVDEHHHTVLNIFANVSAIPCLKSCICDMSQNLVMQFDKKSAHPYLFRLIYNYFNTQDFEVQNAVVDNRFINGLRRPKDMTIENKDLLKLQAQIWKRLLQNGYSGQIPLRVMQHQQIEDVQMILQML